MTLATALILVVWGGVTAYAVLGGADFGAGVLHLCCSTGLAGRRRQMAITAAIGPVWEANHVWLIFVLTGLLTAFPDAFAALGSVALAPAALALAAIVVRGAALACNGQLGVAERVGRPVRMAFGVASLAAPLLLGALAGGLARQRLLVIDGHIFAGGGLPLWVGPFQLVTGLLAVAACAALAAVALAGSCARSGEIVLAASFRRQAIRATVAVVALAAIALAVSSASAPELFRGLTGRGLPAVIVGFAALCSTLVALGRRRDRAARAAISLAVVSLIWGWGLAQFPRLLGPRLTVAAAAAPSPELHAVAIAIAGGAALLVPSMWLLYGAFRRHAAEVAR
jgi:cytochrome bd ubiquinol oxidase subunit II